MKKTLALLLAVIMVFSLAACGGEKNTDVKDNPATDTAESGEGIVEKINMVYGDDAVKVTLTKPEGASFTLGSDTPDDAGDLVGICADDYSWDGEIMGYKYYEGIGSNVPFVDYYFAGEVNSEKYEEYEEEVTDLGIAYDGKAVMAIRYTYKEVDAEEGCLEYFVGFEYAGAADSGLMGVKIIPSDTELSEDTLKTIFTELFMK